MNSVNALRLGLAALVVVSHCAVMSIGYDPLGAWTGSTVDLGTIAVDGFFVLSGFLIVRSYEGSPSTGRYLWRRCLRILPGFWVCLLVTVFVLLPLAQLLQGGSLRGLPWTGNDSMIGYLVTNATLYIDQFHVRGMFGGGPVNGSLYTLFYEFLCYVGVAVLGAAGILHRRPWVLLVVAGLFAAVAVEELASGGFLTEGNPARGILLRFPFMFVCGALAHLYAHRIPVRRSWTAVAAVVFGLALLGARLGPPGAVSVAAYLVLAPAALGYLILRAGLCVRLSGIGSRNDLSYGLYVYAWPVQALWLLTGAGGWPLPLYVVVSMATALAMAYASWKLVESPALALKSWTPRMVLNRRKAPA